MMLSKALYVSQAFMSQIQKWVRGFICIGWRNPFLYICNGFHTELRLVWNSPYSTNQPQTSGNAPCLTLLIAGIHPVNVHNSDHQFLNTTITQSWATFLLPLLNSNLVTAFIVLGLTWKLLGQLPRTGKWYPWPWHLYCPLLLCSSLNLRSLRAAC